MCVSIVARTTESYRVGSKWEPEPNVERERRREEIYVSR